MSREHSLEDLPQYVEQEVVREFSGASVLQLPMEERRAGNRKASNSFSSGCRTAPGPVAQRPAAYYHSVPSSSSQAGPSSLNPPANTAEGSSKRIGLKRRISTPSAQQQNFIEAPVNEGSSTSGTRARSTSLSIVPPGILPHDRPQVLADSPPVPRSAPPGIKSTLDFRISLPSPPHSWSGIRIIPPSPESTDPKTLHASTSGSINLLTSVYNLGQSLISHLQKHRHSPLGRNDPGYSENGLDGSEEDETVASFDSTAGRTSEDFIPQTRGRYWGLGGESPEASGYFSLPPTPPEEKDSLELHVPFDQDSELASLPTPALSRASLSRQTSKRRSRRRADSIRQGEATHGWWRTVLGVWTSSGSGKTSEVLRELGWTLAVLVGLFVVTAATALWMIRSLPITQLKQLPTSTTDLQLLSAEIRSYMASSDIGWWHTIGVLTFVGCWKHAWSVPGAVILNILAGSLLGSLPALLLLTIITASGSLCSYLLSRPLAPLIAVLFPRPLAVVRAALAPLSVLSPSASADTHPDKTKTPSHTSDGPALSPRGGPVDKANVWRRLLIMRAMGFVPWSGMNVACGVVGVDWKIFWLTTAAGSASWSYVTASVGDLLSKLAIPASALAASAMSENDGAVSGESLTALLRDPILIFKLVILSALTLLPVILKGRKGISADNIKQIPPTAFSPLRTPQGSPVPPIERGLAALRVAVSPPMSPLTQSLAKFTPTPAAFDLLSFGRTAVRNGGKVVLGGARSAAGALDRMIGSAAR